MFHISTTYYYSNVPHIFSHPVTESTVLTDHHFPASPRHRSLRHSRVDHRLERGKHGENQGKHGEHQEKTMENMGKTMNKYGKKHMWV